MPGSCCANTLQACGVLPAAPAICLLSDQAFVPPAALHATPCCSHTHITTPSLPAALGAYGVIIRQEGVRALWTGTTPNIARNSVVNAAELATYDTVRVPGEWVGMGGGAAG